MNTDNTHNHPQEEIEERKRAEEEPFKNRELESAGTLLGGIAHDLNNTLTSIFGNIEIAKRKLPHDHAAYTCLEAASESFERVTNLINQLWTFSKGGAPLLETANTEHIIKESTEFSLSDPEKPESTSGHILVMDDKEMIRDFSVEILESYGYTTDFAVDGKDVIEKYSSAEKSGHPFDIVIMDLTIPAGIGGKETVEKLLAMDSKVKIIVSSGYSTDPVMANYSDYGFKGRIVKPFRVEDFEKEVSRVMGQI